MVWSLQVGAATPSCEREARALDTTDTTPFTPRRLVLVDFDWGDADLLPRLLRHPESSVRLVAGCDPEQAGLDREAFWYFDAVRNTWSTEAGEFEILVGGSSRDVNEKRSVMLEPEPRGSRFHTGLTVKTLLDHPESRAVVTKFAGGFLLMADMSMAVEMTLDQIASNHPNFISQALLAQIEKELAKIK